MIGKYAEKFPYADPDTIAVKASFATVSAFAVMWKEQQEYQERFQYFWNEKLEEEAKQRRR
jgi:hypothetical protein